MGWIIFGAVALAIVLLLISPAALRFEYGDDIRLRISWLFVTILKYPAVKKKTRRRNKKTESAVQKADAAAEKIADSSPEEKSGDAEKANASEEKSGSAGKANTSEKTDKPASGGDNTGKKKGAAKTSLGDIFEMVKLVLDSLKKPLKKILKRTRIHHLRLYIVCGGEDAAKAAINFGRTNILVGNALGWIDSFFTLKPADEINITVDFQSEETKAEASCTVKMPLYAALAFLFTVFGRAVRYYRNHPEAQRALRKLTKK